jgi:hypothetical protein
MLNFTGTSLLRLPILALSALGACLATSSAHAANTAPTITGTPPTSVAVGKSYYFKPSASDRDGDQLTFYITNKPSWATFSSKTGALTGYPKSGNVGITSDIVIAVGDGTIRSRLKMFSIRVTSWGTAGNTAPKIWGSPSHAAKVNQAYWFKPSASDANGDKLTFSITNKPAWAAFNTATGALSGTPSKSSVGTTSSIVIRVSDGKLTAALPSFSLTVTTSSAGTATVSWTPPTRNVDGSALTSLAGYRIRYGTNRSSLSNTITVTNVGVTRYVVQNLPVGTWYFGVQAYSSGGAQSALSTLASKTIR